jgi:hypothetical protein
LCSAKARWRATAHLLSRETGEVGLAAFQEGALALVGLAAVMLFVVGGTIGIA